MNPFLPIIVIGCLLLLWLIARMAYHAWMDHQHRIEDLRWRQAVRTFETEKARAIPIGLINQANVSIGADGSVAIEHFKHTQRTVPTVEPLALPAPSLDQPPLETIIEELTPNSLSFAYGRNIETGDLVTTTLPKAVHIQLLGASGQGKSRQATSILTQLAATNDMSHLHLALIDCEGETTAPFQQLPHVRYHADEPREAAKAFRALVAELERRDETRATMPVVLIFVEEFLNLRRTMPETYRDQALEDYTTLALRGRKRGLFLFSIGQTSYSEKSIRDAQAQFMSSMAFAVKPTAARAAGFSNTNLLNKLYADRRPGQFLLERPAGDAILLAPYVDSNVVSTLLDSTAIESSLKVSRNQSRNQIDPALEAKLAQVCQLLSSGSTNKADIMLAVWSVKPGNSEKYKVAEAEYKQIMAHLAQERMEG